MNANTVQLLLDNFQNHFKSVMISSITLNNEPYISYAPFVVYNDKYYVLMSEIAEHYQNIKHIPLVSLLWIEDEKDSSHIFFRKRLSIPSEVCIVEPIPEVITKFKENFGSIVTQLLGMDFRLIECTPKEGIFNIGPGAAYYVNEHKMITSLIKPEGGHKPKK